MFFNISNGVKYQDCIRPCIQVLGADDELTFAHYFAQSNSVAYVDVERYDLERFINALRKETFEDEDENTADEEDLFFVEWDEGNANVTVDDGTSIVRIMFSIPARSIDKFVNYLQEILDKE